MLISLDGFRADFLNRGLTPALNAFIESGVSPKYMLPSFPSVTFPNHFTLVTGLYPESHGIVGNQFWDPVLQEEFYYTDTKVSMQPKWWNAEPLWVTAEKQNVRTAVHMWPGSEAHVLGVEPTYLDKYNGSELLTRKVERILDWLDLPGEDDAPGALHTRPQLILSYVPNVDADGHSYGPNSTEIRATIADTDSMLALLVEGLYARNLTEIVNLVVVSDHGMATTSTHRLIQLDDIVDLSLVDHIDGWPLQGLRLKNPARDLPLLYNTLLAESQNAGSFDVYTLETMPERYHFTNNVRIAPLWIVPKTGWAVVAKADFDVAEALATGRDYHPRGLHGYDHEHPLMRAIFVARGPAFPHMPNSKVAVFQNIELYNIVCDSVGIAPHANNGTLRLPLKTVGLHSDPEHNTPLETPDDPPLAQHDAQDAKPQTARPSQSSSPSPSSPSSPTAADDGSPSHETTHPNSDSDSGSSHDDGHDDEDKDEDAPQEPEHPPPEEKPPSDPAPQKTYTGWWDFIHQQIEQAKEWAKQFVDAIKGNHPPGTDANADADADAGASARIDGSGG